MMKKRLNVIGNLLKFSGFMAFVLLLTDITFAQSSKGMGKAMGEVASASQTTINGTSVISGMTVFSNNRIKTSGEGAAIINLGKIGRIEFGPETDMTLSFTRTSIGGELRSNNVVVSAPAGVAISIKTAKGMVTTDGQKPAVLTIDADSERSRIITHLGEARVISSRVDGGLMSNRVVQGEELSQSSASTVESPDRADQPDRPDRVTSPADATASPNGASFPRLFNAGVGYSMAPDPNSGAGYQKPFETSITCVNDDDLPCRRKSEYKP
jgi:hypothetical protein